MGSNKADFLIVGGGIVGLAIAQEIRARFPAASVLILEKESGVALHASGRNSGVIHAGFYYSPESLKAKLTRDGNERMKRFCLDNKLPISQNGKVVVAQKPEDVPILTELGLRSSSP
jgi:L-2-hydroxyglutarate oxidase LhgO